MDDTKRKKLEAAGWRVGSTGDFLGLSPEESAYVEFRLLLSHGLKQYRTRTGISQKKLAARIGSSQSRIAKAEAGDQSVSLDLLMRAIFATGAKPAEIAGLIDPHRSPPAEPA